MSEGVQDTGNPVLDSTVNLAKALASERRLEIDQLTELHQIVLELAAKEPNGLMRRAEKRLLEDAP